MYQQRFIRQLQQRDDSRLGTLLGMNAMSLGISVAQLARAIGASRQTVYNWMRGGTVFVAYRASVERIIKILQTEKTSEEAWRKICQAFNLQP